MINQFFVIFLMFNRLLTGYHINPINAAIIATTIPIVAVIAAKLRLEE